MNLLQKSALVEELFEEVDREISNYKAISQVYCSGDCGGECCRKKDIYATILEFIPLAFYLHKNRMAEEVYSEATKKENEICVLYSSEGGKCLTYDQRGLICRLFGFSSIRDKNGNPVVITCRFIKSKYNYSIEAHQPNIIMPDYHKRLSLIDIRLGTQLHHINTAIQNAIEITGLFLKYEASTP